MSAVATARRLVGRVGGMALVVPLAMVATAMPAHAVVADRPQATASFNGQVRTVVYDGSTVYVGGSFTTARDSSGSATRQHVAAIDAASGRLLPWNPNVNGAVWSIAVSGDSVYLGGSFSRVDGAYRENLAKVSASGDGALDSAFSHRVNGRVQAMTGLDGTLYIGGTFSAVDGADRHRLAAVGLSGDTLARWSPDANNNVSSLQAGPGRIYAGGAFSRMNDNSGASFLTALDPSDGSIDWSFDPSISYTVLDLSVTGTSVYAGAAGAGGHLRAFTLSGGSRWTLTADGDVQALTVVDDTVYFGGHFVEICDSGRIAAGDCRDGGAGRSKLAATSLDGRLLDWAPQANSWYGVGALDGSGVTGTVAAGGTFTRLGGGSYSRPYFAQFG